MNFFSAREISGSARRFSASAFRGPALWSIEVLLAGEDIVCLTREAWFIGRERPLIKIDASLYRGARCWIIESSRLIDGLCPKVSSFEQVCFFIRALDYRIWNDSSINNLLNFRNHMVPLICCNWMRIKKIKKWLYRMWIMLIMGCGGFELHLNYHWLHLHYKSISKQCRNFKISTFYIHNTSTIFGFKLQIKG